MPLINEKAADFRGMEVRANEVSFTQGSAVTQQTNRTTGVTINSAVGQITLNNTSLAAATRATFTVTNNRVTAKSVVQVCLAGGQTADTSIVAVTAVAAGSFNITVANLNATTADTGVGVVNFVVLGGS